MAEYGLLVGLVAVVSLGAITYLGESAEGAFEAAGNEIDGGGAGASADGGGGGAPGPTTPGPTTPGPTVPTTTPASISTTAPPATTTTTTPSYSGPASAVFSDVSATKSGSNWRSKATVTLTGTGGEPIPDGAVVKINVVRIDEKRRGDDVTTTETITRTVTGGRIVLDHQHSGDQVDEVQYRVVDVTFSDPSGPQWDRKKPTVTIDAP